MIGRRVAWRQPVFSVWRRALSAQRRTDAEYIALLQRELPAAHAASLHQFDPMWQHVAETVAAESTAPLKILDLASGTNAEPACTLANRFSAASIVASEYTAQLCAIALESVNNSGLTGRVEVEEIDLNELAALASRDAGANEVSMEDAPSIDAVTCSLGLFMLRTEQQGKCLQGIHTLLAPRGHLVATVWDSMPLMDIGGRVLAKVLGRDPEDTPPMPFSPTSLGNGGADALLAASGFELAARHNETHQLRLNLGLAGSDQAWMLGLLPFTGTLAALHQNHGLEGVFERARIAFEVEVDGAGCVDEVTGEVNFELGYRLLSARKAS